MDSAEWESADRLIDILEALEDDVREEVSGRMNLDALEAINNQADVGDDEEVDDNASSAQFANMKLISSGRKSFWVHIDQCGRQIEQQLSHKNMSLTRLANAAGYLNDRSNRIEIQSARRGFRQDSHILDTVGLDRSEYLDTSMRHSQKVGAEFYENGEQYRYVVQSRN